MSRLPKHRMEEAKEKLREKLSYERLIKLPRYRNLTREQYFVLIKNIESICLIMLEAYLDSIKA